MAEKMIKQRSMVVKFSSQTTEKGTSVKDIKIEMKQLKMEM